MKLSTLQKGLVLHLPLDEESLNPATKRFTDKSAYSNHGTGAGTQLGSATPGFQADRMGQLVRSAPFGGDDYVNCGNDSSLDITDEITISMWIKPSIQVLDSAHIISKRTSTTGYFMFLGTIADPYVGFIVKIGGSSKSVNSNDNLVVNNWYNVIGRYNGSEVCIFVNGIKQAIVTSASGNIDINSLNLDIGRYSNGTLFYKGDISDVRIYNRALSQAEITLLHESYRPGWKI